MINPTVAISQTTAELALSVFEDILNDASFADIEAAVVELREVLGLTDTEYALAAAQNILGLSKSW